MKKEIKTNYHSNGNRSYEISYVNDKIHGLRIWWYPNGNKSSETTYKNNLEHGSSIYFNY